MHVEVGGVDDDVGTVLQRLEFDAFGFDAFEQGPLPLQRMGSPRRFEAADEDFVGGVEEDDAQRQSLIDEVADRRLQLGVLRSALGVDDDCDLRQGAVGAGDEFDERTHHLRRQIVDDVPVHVFEHVGHGGAARSGHAGDEHYLDGVVGSVRFGLHAHTSSSDGARSVGGHCVSRLYSRAELQCSVGQSRDDLRCE